MLQVEFIKNNFSKVIDSLKKRNKDYSSDLKKIIDFLRENRSNNIISFYVGITYNNNDNEFGLFIKLTKSL